MPMPASGPLVSASAPRIPKPRAATAMNPVRNRIVDVRMVVFLFVNEARGSLEYLCSEAIVLEKAARSRVTSLKIVAPRRVARAAHGLVKVCRHVDGFWLPPQTDLRVKNSNANLALEEPGDARRRYLREPRASFRHFAV